MIIVDLKQGTDEWFQEKLGKPSASNISKIITSTGKASTQKKDYMYTLAAERITGERYDPFQKTREMEIGNEREDESRKLYSMLKNCEVKEVGVVYKDEKKRFLCSPDGITEKGGLELKTEKGGLELKNVMPKTQVEYLIKGTLPTEYFVQIQFSLYVTGFDTWDFMSYCPKLPHLLISCGRDIEFIKKMEESVLKFCDELDTLTKSIL